MFAATSIVGEEHQRQRNTLSQATTSLSAADIIILSIKLLLLMNRRNFVNTTTKYRRVRRYFVAEGEGRSQVSGGLCMGQLQIKGCSMTLKDNDSFLCL